MSSNNINITNETSRTRGSINLPGNPHDHNTVGVDAEAAAAAPNNDGKYLSASCCGSGSKNREGEDLEDVPEWASVFCFLSSMALHKGNQHVASIMLL